MTWGPLSLLEVSFQVQGGCKTDNFWVKIQLFCNATIKGRKIFLAWGDMIKTFTKQWEKVWWAPLHSTQVSFQVQVHSKTRVLGIKNQSKWQNVKLCTLVLPGLFPFSTLGFYLLCMTFCHFGTYAVLNAPGPGMTQKSSVLHPPCTWNDTSRRLKGPQVMFS